MLGGGAIAAMVQSIRSNRNLLKEKSRKTFNNDHSGSGFRHKKLEFKQVPPHQTQKFLQDFKAKKKREKNIRIALWVIGVMLIGLAIYFISK